MNFNHNRSSAEIANGKFRRLSQIFSEGVHLEVPESDQLGGFNQLFGFLSDRKKKIGENLPLAICRWLSPLRSGSASLRL